MYKIPHCNLAVFLNTGANDAQFMRTPRHDDANNRHRNEAGINRNHDEDSEVDGDKRRVFINHTITTTSIKPTHAPVHDRIRKTLLTRVFILNYLNIFMRAAALNGGFRETN